MDKLEILAHAEVRGASRDLIAMQALARKVVDAEAKGQRHHVLARQLRRDLDAAILGRAAPWREARTRFEARKLARMQTGEKPVAAPTERAPEPAFHAAPGERNELLHVGAAFVALALWLAWAGQLAAQNAIAWDGGTGPAQTSNLVSLYAPAVLALLATLVAINPPNHSSDRLTNAPDR